MDYDDKLSEESGSRFSDDGHDPLLDHPLRNIQQQDCKGQQRSRQLHLLTASVVFFCFSLVILITTISTLFYKPQNYCVKTLNTWSPAMNVLTDRYETVRFTGHRTKYRGPPNVEVDDAWDQLTRGSIFSINHETLRRIQAPEYAAKLPESSGGGYMAIYEYVHHLHCLNKLRQHIYPEYYRNHSSTLHRTPEETAVHLDHCTDMLRQKLMCDADISVITYNWYDDSDYPIANFDTQHKCRDFSAVQDWVHKRRVKTLDGRVYKPGDAVVLPS